MFVTTRMLNAQVSASRVVRNAEGAEYNTAKMEQYLVSALGGHAAVVFQHHIRKPVETGFECLT